METDRPTEAREAVLTCVEPAGGAVTTWARVAALGWLPDAARIEVQLGHARSGAIDDAAAALRACLDANRVEVIMRDDDQTEADLAADPPIAVVAVTVPTLTVPRVWFTDAARITIATPVPCPALRVAAVLAAGARPLQQLGNRDPLDTLAFEADRLAPPSLAAACGYTADGQRWWAIGRSASAVDEVVGNAIGLSRAQLPALATAARHTLLPPPVVIGPALPALDVHAATAVRAAVRRWSAAGVRAVRAAARDGRAIRRNGAKVPAFVRRRLAGLLRNAR
jgi:hypothetical protein